jgi:hypothetical protein
MPAKQEGPRGFEMSDPQGRTQEELPAPTFATFVLSLSTSALLQLGAIEDPSKPAAAEREPDLAMARYTIDILEVLSEKTRGNLDEQEQELLSGVLHDLHMRFVEAQKG